MFSLLDIKCKSIRRNHERVIWYICITSYVYFALVHQLIFIRYPIAFSLLLVSSLTLSFLHHLLHPEISYYRVMYNRLIWSTWTRKIKKSGMKSINNSSQLPICSIHFIPLSCLSFAMILVDGVVLFKLVCTWT